MKSNLSFINVYKKANIKSEIVTQLLYGDQFKKIIEKKSWIKIKNESDQYKGFVKKSNFLSDKKNTHKVYKLSASLYSKPRIKNKVKKKLSFGSKISVIEKKGNFYKFDNLWIKKNDLKKINFRSKNIFNNIKKFIGIKYKWGGKHFSGIDCSALVQLHVNFNNRFCPRDSKDQIKFFKKKVKLDLDNVKRNDLIFWKGHVALVVSKKNYKQNI